MARSQCPKCGSIWSPGTEEFATQHCDCCGWPYNDDDDEFDGWDDDDEEEWEDDYEMSFSFWMPQLITQQN